MHAQRRREAIGRRRPRLLTTTAMAIAIAVTASAMLITSSLPKSGQDVRHHRAEVREPIPAAGYGSSAGRARNTIRMATISIPIHLAAGSARILRKARRRTIRMYGTRTRTDDWPLPLASIILSPKMVVSAQSTSCGE